MEGNNTNGNMPTEKQLDMICKLAKRTKSSVDLNKVTTKQEASKVIEDLIAKQNGNGNNGNNSNDSKGHKIAYGLAVKLVFARYQQLSMDTKTDGFWKDVDEFYQQYLEHQDRVINSVFRGD
jgi:hypothetical protein